MLLEERFGKDLSEDREGRLSKLEMRSIFLIFVGYFAPFSVSRLCSL
jgi:hypothetical protein